eukprot:2762305-Pyramimonas_sp.AAC.1
MGGRSRRSYPVDEQPSPLADDAEEAATPGTTANEQQLERWNLSGPLRLMDAAHLKTQCGHCRS